MTSNDNKVLTIPEWNTYTLEGRRKALTEALQGVQIGDRDREILASASDLSRMRKVIQAMEQTGVNYSFELYGLSEPRSGGSKTFFGQVWDYVTSAPVMLAVGGFIGMGAFTGASSASGATAAETTAASTTVTEGASMNLENWTDFGSASDAAAASNVVASSPSFWDRLTGIGERALEYGVKTAISKEIYGANQQPISTQAMAGATPLANPIPTRGFADSVSNYANAMDMKPFLWIAAAFGFVVVFLLAFSRR